MVAEEIGKVASGTVDALRNQPLMLALVVLQAFVLGAVLYSSLARQAAIDKQFAHVFELLGVCMKSSAVELKDVGN
jgi:hypothetical protein